MSLFCQTYLSSNEAETESLAKALALISQKGDTYALFGTLGSGKSVFARAFIKALTHATEIPSPTFTLVQTYEADDFEIYHFDLYRLKSPEEIWELNMEEALYGAVSLIEWPEKMGSYLPRNIFKITILPQPNGTRLFQIETEDEKKRQRLQTLHFISEA